MNLETTKNALPADINYFFKDLSEYLETKLYFIGSVQRSDYSHNNSDIDVLIFSENEHSTKIKVQHFLNVKKNKIKKVILKIDNNSPVINGYKIKYESTKLKNPIEFVIYNEKHKQLVLDEFKKQLNRTYFYIVWALIILKFLYYRLNMLTYKFYSSLKWLIMYPTYYNLQFVVLENI